MSGNVGTIGHIDACRIIAALDSVNLKGNSEKLIVCRERTERIELTITKYPEIQSIIHPLLPVEKPPWRERRVKGGTGIAKARRAAKKRRSRR